MTHNLPPRPSLEQLKNQAKDLRRACRNIDSEALRRIQQHLAFSTNTPPVSLTLSEALYVIAREYGFESWPRLKKHVELVSENTARRAYLQQQVERFSVPRGDWRTLLDVSQELERAGEAGLEAALEGLSHPNPLVRRACAGYMDHRGTDACIPGLKFVALHDLVPSVRRTAVHSLTCQRCKPCPLTGDLVGVLVEVALSDPNMRVRQEAVSGLSWQSPDARAIAALNRILQEESNKELLRLAHFALKRQDPEYRRAVDARNREQGILRYKEREG